MRPVEETINPRAGGAEALGGRCDPHPAAEALTAFAALIVRYGAADAVELRCRCVATRGARDASTVLSWLHLGPDQCATFAAIRREIERQLPDLPAKAGVVGLTSARGPHGASRITLTLDGGAGARGPGTLVATHAAPLWSDLADEQLVSHLSRLIDAVQADPGADVLDARLLDDGELDEVLRLGRGGPAPAPEVLHERFFRHAREHPLAEAVQCGPETVSYGELAARSQALALELGAAGIGRGDVVALLLPRRPEWVMATLAVLAAGAAFLPLDPAYPADRLEVMLEDSGTRELLTTKELAGCVPRGDRALRVLEPVAWGSAPAIDASYTSSAAPDDLAYLMYTSGSSGRPKGVMIEHRSAAALASWARENFSADELSGVLASTPSSFDLSVFELFAPLSAGGRVILVDELAGLFSLAEQAGVTLVNAPPSVVAAYLGVAGRALPASVRTVCLAGEALSRDLAEQVRRQPGVRRVVNAYGPTEDTVYSTASDVLAGTEAPAIGRPLPGSDAYVLDARGRPCPRGAVGELHLAGAGLARGYHGNARLTAERFVTAGLAPGLAPRRYRTGDLVRWRVDGQLQFLGRADTQIKLHGIRIEPGEIEGALLARPDVLEAVVVLDRSVASSGRLIAYFTSSSENPPSAAELSAHLSERLPHALVPSVFVALPELPLTPSGKIDRGQLPAPQRVVAEPGAVGPMTHDESILADLWTELLELDSPPRSDDDFFDLGGDSLLALTLVAMVESRIGTTVSVQDLLRSGRFADAAAALRDGGNGHRARLTGLRQGLPEATLYCMMAASRELLALRSLAAVMRPGQGLVGVRALPEGSAVPSVEQAAADCLALVRGRQPAGPYALAGYSYGGNVAFEMACLLQSAGEEVSLLCLLDSVAPAPLQARLRRTSKHFLSLPGSERTRHAVGLVSRGSGRAARALTRRWEKEPANSASSAEMPRARYFDMQAKAEAHRPSHFRGDVLIYHTSQTAAAAGDRRLGWSRHVSGVIESVEVAGDHHSFMRADLVGPLAHDLITHVGAPWRAAHGERAAQGKRVASRG